MLGNSHKGRGETLFESVSKAMVLRQGKWEYLQPSEGLAILNNTGMESGNSPHPQLYNMTYDRGQRNNLAEEYPHIVEAMEGRIQEMMGSSQP